MYVYFGFTVPLKAYCEVLVNKKLICVVVIFPPCCLHWGKIICVETDNGDNFSALAAHHVDCSFHFVLLYLRCCPQRRKNFRVDPYNAEKSSALIPTTQKNDPHCWPQRRSFSRVVDNNVKKLSALLSTTRKFLIFLKIFWVLAKIFVNLYLHMLWDTNHKVWNFPSCCICRIQTVVKIIRDFVVNRTVCVFYGWSFKKCMSNVHKIKFSSLTARVKFSPNLNCDDPWQFLKPERVHIN